MMDDYWLDFVTLPYNTTYFHQSSTFIVEGVLYENTISLCESAVTEPSEVYEKA